VLSFVTLAQALGLAFAAGLDLYATVAVIGIAVRLGWVTNVPTTFDAFANIVVIVIALALYVVGFIATLAPGVSSAWETLHSLIRPPAAAVLAAMAAWHADPIVVLVAALLGGGVAIVTHTTKLGTCYAMEASPRGVSNGVANIVELVIIVALVLEIFPHPFITLAVALVLLACFVVMLRLIWKALGQVYAGRWMPAHGLMQAPRVMERRGRAHDDPGLE
jgi:hypothetical protein